MLKTLKGKQRKEEVHVAVVLFHSLLFPVPSSPKASISVRAPYLWHRLESQHRESRCPRSGLCAHEGYGRSLAGSPRSVFPPSLTATPVLLGTLVSSARSTVLGGLADSCVGLASSPSPVNASDCTPKRARSSRIISNTSSSSDVIAQKIVELRRFQSERFPSTWSQISGNQMCALARTVARSRENRARIGGAWGIPHFLVTHFSTFAPLIAAKTNSFAIASVTWTPYTRLVSLLICSAHDSLSSTHSSRSLMRLPSRASLVRNIVGCELLTSSSTNSTCRQCVPVVPYCRTVS